ncbi:hypothetical protein [Pengzhenrongella frigida]|uniref:Uncharacterized protein n=1 Tax=Pengzhenrongella frigida TaxID=1259133 RepID=A0A4Q5MZI2_9MICO|nr:hypothetical protein [Cellulomonas sp. HLT2-17]RYV51126.1 hypothetical protein EUA98_10130 [Cellulomonas sp. HLT2-17]
MLLQKVVTPALTEAYLVGGHDRVAGYVVRTTDVDLATRPPQLIAAHGLTDPRFPFRADAPWLDVLRFEASPQFQYLPGDADTLVPQWWLRHSRLTPGAELLRMFDDGSCALLARYGDVGTGWDVSHTTGPRASIAPLSRCVGPVALWHGSYVDADLVDDGRSVVLALDSPPLKETGFTPTENGRWRRVVPRHEVDELFELDVVASWHGLEVRMVDQWMDGRRDVIARISALSDDGQLAEQLSMPCVEPGLYESVVPAAELDDLVARRLVLDVETMVGPELD